MRYPRLVPKDEECAKQLAKRTLTNLYNQRPTWLDNLHRRLDVAVAAQSSNFRLVASNLNRNALDQHF